MSLRIETTVLNSTFDKASTELVHAPPRSHASRIKNFLEQFYSLGVGFGLLGMILGYLLLLWSCLTVFRGSGKITDPVPNITHLAHDESEPLSSSEGSTLGSTGLAVQPIIPGVTVPLSHMPVLLMALLVSQVIHEAGHALASIPEDVPVLSVGLGLTVCLPSAFVSLGSAAFDRLSSLSRMRIATAGAYHNIVLWLLIAFLGWSGLGQFLSQGWTGWGTPFGLYKTIDDVGVSIKSVEFDSDLSQYLYPGDIITRIEDTVLAQAQLLSQRRTPLQLWHDLLLHHHHNVTIEDLPDMGWCVDKKWYEAQPTDCCSNPSSSPLVCFTPSSSKLTSAGTCLDPFKIYNPPETPMALVHGRCATACITAGTAVAEDEPEQVCIRAKGVTRIGVVRNGKEETVLWNGPSEEIWEQVSVDEIVPRYWFIPLGLPELCALFISYTSTITLSLFFLNLLPIRHLDGAQVLSALLDILAPPSLASSHSPTIPFSPTHIQLEAGLPSRDYAFSYESPIRQPRVLRRHTSTPSYSNSPLPSGAQTPRAEKSKGIGGWIAKRRKGVERFMEALAIGLVGLVAVGNAWVLMGR
ncbi:hypothetical protein BDV93DRAFT_557216 [Ceratobasidium sp. AG-I]|nr:hypothetical protein BDV93DRAFT_557216 [Ceratobasidium sp. AG-I]